MNSAKFALFIFFFFVYSSTNPLFAQKGKPNHLYTFGHASAFIGGLYDGHITYGEIKPYGNFGLGAPDKLDGEIVIFNNKFYQTQSTGKPSKWRTTSKRLLLSSVLLKAKKALK